MNALKARWLVRAGVIPGRPEPEYDRDFTLTSFDFERPVRLSGDERAELFARRRDEALDYARELMDPKRLNWVTVEFIWV